MVIQSWSFLALQNIHIIAGVSEKTSSVPALWVEKLTCWLRPKAEVLSLQIWASGSSWSLMWTIKSPVITKFLSFTRCSPIHSVNSSIKVPVVIMFMLVYGGLYILMSVTGLCCISALHLPYWKECIWSLSHWCCLYELMQCSHLFYLLCWKLWFYNCCYLRLSILTRLCLHHYFLTKFQW